MNKTLKTLLFIGGAFALYHYVLKRKAQATVMQPMIVNPANPNDPALAHSNNVVIGGVRQQDYNPDPFSG